MGLDLRTTVYLACLAAAGCSQVPNPLYADSIAEDSDSSGSDSSPTTGTESGTSDPGDGDAGDGDPGDGDPGDGDGDGDPGDGDGDGDPGPICGNGVLEAQEECDDGNMDDDDACTPNCEHATCGDGFKWVGEEECDDGNMIDDDDCSNACERGFMLVFVTSETYSGPELTGGLGAIDAKCQALADAAGFGGTFKAWLSDSMEWPDSRFTHATVSYRLSDETTVIADDWADLVDGTLQNPINLDENKGMPPEGTKNICMAGLTAVWSNTEIDGTAINFTSNCDDWSGKGDGAWGRFDTTDLRWTKFCTSLVGECSNSWSAGLYCFEQ